MAKRKFRLTKARVVKAKRSLRNKSLHIGERMRKAMSRIRSVAVDTPQVIDLGDPTLREAFRLWWHPYDMGPDFDELTGRSDREFMRGDQIVRHKLDPGYYRRIKRAFRGPIFAVNPKTGRKVKVKLRKPRPMPSRRVAPVKVVIRLDYPLRSPQSKVVTIDRKYPGEIFALTHDFYRELYAQDVKGGGKEGPAAGGPMLNRGFGPMVWGHDMGDLAFGSCHYRKFSLADAKKYGAEGEFTFGIGS